MSEDKQVEVQFSLERIYVKDISYEAPGVPRVFLEPAAPQLNVQIGIQHELFNAAENLHQVVLSVSANARHDDKSIFLVEVQQAGLFRVNGVSGELLEKTLEISCPYILLPFAREAVSDLVSKGGLPQLLVNPINFEALYEQKRASQKAQVKQ